jgi:hypothetical protein
VLLDELTPQFDLIAPARRGPSSCAYLSKSVIQCAAKNDGRNLDVHMLRSYHAALRQRSIFDNQALQSDWPPPSQTRDSARHVCAPISSLM